MSSLLKISMTNISGKVSLREGGSMKISRDIIGNHFFFFPFEILLKGGGPDKIQRRQWSKINKNKKISNN